MRTDFFCSLGAPVVFTKPLFTELAPAFSFFLASAFSFFSALAAFSAASAAAFSSAAFA
jgi:hypothetical protein